MDVNRVDDNRIQFIIYESDAQSNGLSLADLPSMFRGKTPLRSGWYEFFEDMLEQAIFEYDFNVNSELLVEVAILDKTTVEVVVSKVGAQHIESRTGLRDLTLDRPNQRGLSENRDNRREVTRFSVVSYCFKTLDDILSLKERLDVPLVCYIYKYQKTFYMLIESTYVDLIVDKVICEYAFAKSNTSELSVGFLEEHGDFITNWSTLSENVTKGM